MKIRTWTLFITMLAIGRHKEIIPFHSSTRSQWLPSLSLLPHSQKIIFHGLFERSLPLLHFCLGGTKSPTSEPCWLSQGCHSRMKRGVQPQLHTPLPQQRARIMPFFFFWLLLKLSLYLWYSATLLWCTLKWFHLHSICLEFPVFLDL